jgi:hypothetical protein
MDTTKHYAPSRVSINLIRTLGRGADQAGARPWRRPTVPIGWSHRVPVERTNPPVWMRPRGTSLPLWKPIDQGQESLRAPLLDQYPMANRAPVECAEPDVRFTTTKESSLDAEP